MAVHISRTWRTLEVFRRTEPVSTDIHDSDSACTCYTLMRRFTQVEQPLLRGTPTIFDHPLAQVGLWESE